MGAAVSSSIASAHKIAQNIAAESHIDTVSFKIVCFLGFANKTLPETRQI